MKTTFYLIRHAESVAKKNGIVQGAGLAVPLSEKGREQAEALAVRLRDEKFDAIFTSTALRAIDTAKPVRALFPNVPYREIAELNERSKGVAEGMAKEDFEKKYADIEAAWKREEDPRVPGGESFADVERRVMPFITDLAEKSAGKKLLLIFHGNTIRVILGALLDIPHGKRHRLAQGYCAVNIAEYDADENRWHLLKINA